MKKFLERFIIWKRGHKPDLILLVGGVFLIFFGLIMLSSASSDIGKIKFNDTYYYLKHQISFGLGIGTLGFLIGYFVYYRFFYNFALLFLLLSLGALAAVFTPLGFSAGGATRWLHVGPITIQPSELLKLTFVMYLAAWLSNIKANRQTNFYKGYIPFLIISGATGFLILLQKQTSAVVILMFAALVMYFVSGARLSYVLNTIFIGFLGLAIAVYATPYRFDRVMGFLKHDSDLQGTGYQLNQALIAVGSGGLTGIGYGQSTSKYNYLPESIGDSIFAVIAEELGFIGATALILAFFVVVLRGLIIAKKLRDSYGKLLIVGFVSILSIQAFIHIAANIGLMPITGVPLPFISYGGTSLAVFMTMFGIMLNISKYA